MLGQKDHLSHKIAEIYESGKIVGCRTWLLNHTFWYLRISVKH